MADDFETDALRQAFHLIHRDIARRQRFEHSDEIAERLFEIFLSDLRQGFPTAFSHWSGKLVS